MSNMRHPTLPDLPALLFRRLMPGDGQALATHLLELPAWDRVARWNGARSDDSIPDECLALDLAPDSARALAVGALAREGMVGAAVAARLGGGRVELAVTVAPAWRRRGLGTALLRLTWDEARGSLGAERACLEVDPDNVPMLRLRQRVATDLPLDRDA